MHLQLSYQLIASMSCAMLLGSMLGTTFTIIFLISINIYIQYNGYDAKIYEFFYPTEPTPGWMTYAMNKLKIP